MAFPSLTCLLARHPLLFYTATWTAVATAAVSVAAFAPELAFVWAVTPGAGAAPLATTASASCPGGIVLPLDGSPWDAACVPAALFGRVTLDVLVPPVFAAAVVSTALWFTKAVGVWEDDEDDSNEATMV